MKRIFFSAALLCLFFPKTQAQPEKQEPSPDKIKSVISSVTVFDDRARVTRTIEVNLKEGDNVINVTDVPEHMVDSSLRADFANGSKAELLSVEIPREYSDKLNSAELEKAKKEVEEVQDKINAVNDTIGRLNKENTVLAGFDINAKPKGPAEDKPQIIDVNTWKKLLYFSRRGLGRNKAEILKAETAKRNLNHDMDVARNNYRKLQAYTRKSQKIARLKIRSARTEKVIINLNYIIFGAKWYPAYDIHVDPQTAKIELSYFALVSQATGEDWNNCKILLSTARPAQSADLPRLSSWIIHEKNGLQGIDRQVNQFVNAAGNEQGRQVDENTLAQISQTNGTATVNAPVQAESYNRYSLTRSPNPSIAYRNLPHLANRKMQRKHANKNDRFSGRAAQTEALNFSFQNDYLTNVKTTSGKVIQGKLLEANGRELILLDGNNNTINLAIDQAASIWNKTSFQTDNINEAFLVSPYQSSGGFDYRFPVARIETVKSDNKRHRVMLRSTTLKGKKQYFTVPLASPYAFLQYLTENSTKAPILAGPSNIFLGGDYIGEAELTTVPENESFKLSLGIDERVMVKRSSWKHTDNIGVLSNWKRTRIETDITIRNYTKEDIAIVVEERIPVSRNSDVLIKSYTENIASLKPPEEDSWPKGIKRWKLSIGAGQESKLTSGYSIEFPAEVQIGFAMGNTREKLRFSKGIPSQIRKARLKQ